MEKHLIPAVLDFESFFTAVKDERGRPYSLSSLNTEEYIRHPWFEAHGAAYKASPDLPAKWFDHDELPDLFASIDWANTWMIHHHAQFDAFILSHVYNVHPKMLGCTLSMARLMLGNHISVSLDSVRKQFDMPLKRTPYHLFKGLHWNEMPRTTQQLVAEGACDEVESIWNIFCRLMKDGFPVEELEIVDLTMKMFTEPVLRADVDMLARVWEKEDADKKRRNAALGVTESDLQSADRFAELLREAGVEPDMKQGQVTTKTGNSKMIYAFAKTDDFMKDLLDDEDERIKGLAEARLGVKSTILQTRAETLGWMASRGSCPVYLRYAGAHTTRWSGGDGANWQNFNRADPDNAKEASPLRRSIMAPEGYLLGTIDLAQIECRILNWLAGQKDVLENFRNGVDPYTGTASRVYGFPVTKAHPKERGTGKQLELSGGFQAGAATIQRTARLGIYGPPVKIDLQTAETWRDIYRDTHPAVVNYWKEAGRMISRLAGGPPIEWGPMLIKDKRIYGPGGSFLIFDTLEFYRPGPDEDVRNVYDLDGYWRYRSRQGWVKLYSGKLVENVVQWLARLVMSQAMLRMTHAGYRIINTTHDEVLLLLKKDGQEQQHLQWCAQTMRQEPTWLPGIPLDAEASIGERYSK